MFWQSGIALGEPVTVYTHFVVREDAQLLFGFGSTGRSAIVFRDLIVKSTGLAPSWVWRSFPAWISTRLARAVRNNDIGLLTKVPGVGKKTAERLMLEMKSRLDMLTEAGGVPERR